MIVESVSSKVHRPGLRMLFNFSNLNFITCRKIPLLFCVWISLDSTWGDHLVLLLHIDILDMCKWNTVINICEHCSSISQHRSSMRTGHSRVWHPKRAFKWRSHGKLNQKPLYGPSKQIWWIFCMIGLIRQCLRMQFTPPMNWRLHINEKWKDPILWCEVGAVEVNKEPPSTPNIYCHICDWSCLSLPRNYAAKSMWFQWRVILTSDCLYQHCISIWQWYSYHGKWQLVL